MKLLRVHIISAKTCGGLLDGLDLRLRSPLSGYSGFEPLCLIGPNGAGKSQFLQVLAEIFHSVFHKCIPNEERKESNPDLQFELEYLIQPEDEQLPVRVRISQKASGKNRLLIERRDEDAYEWIGCKLDAPKTHALLPRKVVGYTSGDNETLSVPFLLSRNGYAKDVTESALHDLKPDPKSVPDTRLMLIDYGTNLEVLVANLLLGEPSQRDFLLQDAKLQNLHSFRCIIQLAHSAAPNNPKKSKSNNRQREVLITKELQTSLDQFKRCATCYTYDETTETYTFDYWINDQTREAFRLFWNSTLDLYSSFHKLAMLNDLVLPKNMRVLFRKATKSIRFASRLVEPHDEDKVFRFERVVFTAQRTGKEVDYVSLSDGEHQLGQILGTFCMLSSPNVLFLLDEPESHFNPQWRVNFISRILDLPTKNGDRRESSKATEQECLLTTHSPFVPSDMHRDKVFIFSKDEEGKIQVQNPYIETFGTTFDTIIEECFNVRPPMSQVPLDKIKELMQSENPEDIRVGMQQLGDSVEKAFLADRLRQLTNRDGV
ncbi:restriction system-associated AAA family ATPase [Nostoc sp. JL33]|uniref:restriction system-associated AAA family ATPase n=1 Tax=Nostoc sp. JL33 TaxID=2815396 RepID=UPI0025DB642B|nr:restriction system-associated AAA family ATPase [Nostoc sp. JL33]MBN3873874.1 restriction system-associated AAA family ATPase [Nostoc sp. JL33]